MKIPGFASLERRPASVVLLAALGVFFAADDQTSVVAVLPKMIEDIGVAQDQFYRAAWIVNGYILGYIVALPLVGRLADRFGHARVFAVAVALFCAASAWVAVADDLTLLSIARGVQAIGGGALVPIAMAIVTANVPPDRRALGLGAMAAAAEAGALFGPLWGGGVTDLIGWRGVFWLNLPLCLPLAMAMWRLKETRQPADHEAIDLPGAALLGASLLALTIALTDDPIAPRSTPVTIALFAAALALFALFVLRQLRAPAPLVDLALFRRPGLSAAFLANGLVGGALIVALVNVPLFTNVVLGGSPLEGGLNLMRLTIALAGGALAGGYIAGRLGLAPSAAIGLGFAGVGFIGMAQWNEDPSFIELTLPLLTAGFGFGVVIAPLNTAVMNEAAETERATLASLLTVVRLLGALVGVALLTTRGLSGFYTDASLAFETAATDPRFGDVLRDLQVNSFRDTFLVAAGVCFASLLPAAFLGKSKRQVMGEYLAGSQKAGGSNPSSSTKNPNG